MSEENKKFLKQCEIPDHFAFLSKATVQNQIEIGDFPQGKKIGKRVIYTIEEIEKWLSERD